MTATPSMTPKITVTGVVLAVAGVAALTFGLRMVASTELVGGWRNTNVSPVQQTAISETRGTNAMGAATVAGDVSTTRGRN